MSLPTQSSPVSTGGSKGSPPRYPRPKILLVDVDIEEELRKGGYRATSGSFGSPEQVSRAPGQYKHLKAKASLPGYTEQEIIVADLKPPEPVSVDGQDEAPPPRDSSVWVGCDRGIVDPRPLVMRQVRNDLDRIHAHGGVFVFFLDEERDPGYVWGAPSGSSIYVEETLKWSNWDCLSSLSSFGVTSDYGVEMEPATSEVAKNFLLSRYLKGGHFNCVVEPPSWLENRWITLATSKYGDPVAGVLAPEDDDRGWIFLFPRVRHPGPLIREMLDEVLPTLAPALFPHAEGKRWTRREEYELPRVLGLKSRVSAIELEAREQILGLEREIENERHKYSFLHDLLTESGDALVKAVQDALKELGFTDVRDVDSEAERAGSKLPLREDLQIWDRSPTLLIEVKGIGGLPREADSLQIAKYLAPRMREWERIDVKGLAVVNHQRKLPALDRVNDHVFQPDVVTNAEAQEFGLMTTWDLFRIVRGALMHGWRHEQVADLLYGPGRFYPRPLHYERVGTVDDYWEQAGAMSVSLEGGDIKLGDTLAYELPVDFLEEKVTSLRLEDQPTKEAHSGSKVGIKTGLSKQQARRGTPVYAVRGSV